MEDFTNWRRDELRIAHLDRFSFLDVLAPMGLPRWGAAGRAPRKDQVKRFRSSLGDRKSTRLNSSHQIISYAVFCLKKKKKIKYNITTHKTSQPRNSKHYGQIIFQHGHYTRIRQTN